MITQNTMARQDNDEHSTARTIERISLDLLDPMEHSRPLIVENVEQLAESIASHGLFHPIAVIVNGDRYTIGQGHHRAAAFELLGKNTIDAEVWPESTLPRDAMIRSFHENNVRQNESFMATLDRINAFMQEHNCTFSEAAKQAKIVKGTLSKIRKAMTSLSPAALHLVNQNQIGISVAYEVARGSDDENVQVQWLTRHLAGEMSRDAIIEDARRTDGNGPDTPKLVNLTVALEEVTIRVTMPKTIGYQQLKKRLRSLASLLNTQSKRSTPIDLLPRFIGEEASS